MAIVWRHGSASDAKATSQTTLTEARSAWPGALEATVAWYRDNPEWWKRVRSGAYREYYEKQYG